MQSDRHAQDEPDAGRRRRHVEQSGATADDTAGAPEGTDQGGSPNPAADDSAADGSAALPTAATGHEPAPTGAQITTGEAAGAKDVHQLDPEEVKALVEIPDGDPASSAATSASAPADDSAAEDVAFEDPVAAGSQAGPDKDANAAEPSEGRRDAAAAKDPQAPEKKAAAAGANKGRRIFAGSLLLAAAAAGLCAMAAATAWFADPQPAQAPQSAAPAVQTQKARAAKSESAAQIREDTRPPMGPVDRQLARAETMRQRLHDRRRCVETLIQHYRKGITAVEAELLQNAAIRGMPDIHRLRANVPTRLRLRTIQRRLTYIRALEQTRSRLVAASEALLYQVRRARLDRQLVEVIRELDRTAIAKHLKDSIEQQRAALAEPLCDLQTVEGPSLTALWEQIRRNPPDAQPDDTSNPTEQNDHRIWAEVCSGRFDDKYKLTALSAEAAACLSHWDGTVLNLGRLQNLSAKAAEHLARWPGSWLILNGLHTLSAEAAVHLARWPGEVLSLNGIESLSAQARSALAQWEGLQLELTGLDNNDQWEAACRRLFLPQRYHAAAASAAQSEQDDG